MRLTLPREKYDGDAVPAFFRRVIERVDAIPMVMSGGTEGGLSPHWIVFAEAEAQLARALVQVMKMDMSGAAAVLS